MKPEVTRYSGRELLELMGPVETGYCDLEGGQDVCAVDFQLGTPDGITLEELFEIDPEASIGFRFTGPNDCVEPIEGTCLSIEDNCIFEPVEMSMDMTYYPLRDNDFCEEISGCYGEGYWKLEAWWIIDGKELQQCTEMFYYIDG